MRFLKRYRWWLVLLLVLAWIGAGVWRWETYPKGVNFITYCKIRPGMSYEEVKQVIGGGPNWCSEESLGDDCAWWDPASKHCIKVFFAVSGGRAQTKRFCLEWGPATEDGVFSDEGLWTDLKQFFVAHLP